MDLFQANYCLNKVTSSGMEATYLIQNKWESSIRENL